jgi:hypothetical protein
MASNILNLGVTNITTAGIPVSIAAPAGDGPPYYAAIHNENSSTDSISVAPNGVVNTDTAGATPLTPNTGLSIPPQSSIVYGPIFAGDTFAIVPEIVGGGICNVRITLSPVQSFGPLLKRNSKSLITTEGQYRICDQTNDVRISPATTQNWWAKNTVAYLNVYLSPNPLAPADYHAFIVSPNGTDTTSAFNVAPQTALTVGPFTKENVPDVYVPAVAGQAQEVYVSLSPEVDRDQNGIKLDFEHNAITNIANVGGPGSAEMCLPMDDAPGQTEINNLNKNGNPKPRNGNALQTEGIDGWGIDFDGLNQYSISFWLKPEAYPGDANYNGVDAVPYVISNTNVPFVSRWGFVVLLSSKISGYGVDGAIVFQPRHGATPFGAGTGFRNTSPEFLANVGEWTHCVINRNIITGIEIWINGQLAVSDPFNETSANPSNGDITIGCRGNEGVSTFFNRNTYQGQMDEVLLMNRVLTQAEITELYENGARGIN